MIGKDMGLDTKRYSPRLLANGISNLKNELIGPEQAAAEASEAGRSCAHHRRGLRASTSAGCAAANALDFDDLIGETVAVLQAFPQIAPVLPAAVPAHPGRRVPGHQPRAVRAGARTRSAEDRATADGVAPAELCVVGDADQSIYAFRGATIRNIEDFERDLPERDNDSAGTELPLDAEHPVGRQLRHLAQRGRREKRLWTDAGEGELIVGYVADNEHDEARFVAEEIDALADRGDITYNDVAVFYRTNNSSRALEEVFIRAGIPYKVVGGVRFYERREIRDIVAYLRVLDNPGDAVSMRRILNTPRRGIGDRAEACVAVYAENTGASFNDALQAAAEGRVPMLEHALGEVHRGFRRADRRSARAPRRRAGRARRGGAGPHRLPHASWRPPATHRIWPGWTTSTNWSASHTNSAPTWPTPRRSAEPAEVDEDVPDTGVLAAFLERVSLVADADELPEHGAGVVTMMTLHTAKGLEFPVVFVTGWEDGMFPHMRALGDPHRTVRGAAAGLRRHHPGAPAALPQPGQGPLVVGPADAQPRVAVPARDPAGAHRLAAHRPGAVVPRTRQRGGPVRHSAPVTGARARRASVR